MRIGLFLNNLDEEYQLSVYKGIKNEAAALDVELVCVQGESLPTKPPAGENDANDLFPSRNIIGADGILFLSSVLFDRSNHEYEEQLRGMFKGTPFVSVGDGFFDYPSILVNSEKPMHDLMNHLIMLHQYKKPLFIGGPAEHPDNVLRENIFREAIEKHREANPLLQGTVINGNFLEISGMEIVREYMNQHPDDPPDVIVAANDAMAMGARNVLLVQDDPRWNKCPVTGFDDISQSGLEIPALTTVRQPLDELGRLGVRTLVDIIQGKEVPSSITADAKLVVRNSCGCPLKPEQKAANLAQYRAIYHLRYLSALGKSLTSIYTYEEMWKPLGAFLSSLEVPLFFLVVFDRPRPDVGLEGKLIYKKNAEKETYSFDDAREINIKDFFKELKFLSGTTRNWCMRYLRSGDEYLGLVVYEAQDLIHPQLCNGLILLANTVKRLSSYHEKFHDDVCHRLERISTYSKSLAAGNENGNQANDLMELSAMIDETLLWINNNCKEHL